MGTWDPQAGEGQPSHTVPPGSQGSPPSLCCSTWLSCAHGMSWKAGRFLGTWFDPFDTFSVFA